jgi:gliding motility-associated-like protein
MNLVVRLGLTCFLLFFYGITSSAEIVLSGNKVICQGDLGRFTFTVPTGKTVTDYDWDFGDTYTSTKASPTHLFKTSGKFTVKVKVTYSSSTTESFTKDIEVVPLPNASFDWLGSSDTCLYSNDICFKDKSTGANGNQPIVKRTFYWGDGKYNIKNNPIVGQTQCYKYAVADKYYVEMEVEDKLGCKSTASRYVTILDDVVAKINSRVTYPSCTNAVVTYTNASSATGGVDYTWDVDGSTSNKPHFSADPIRKSFTISNFSVAMLKATAKSGCSDSITVGTQIEIADPSRTLQFKSKRICYGERYIIATIDRVKNESISWYLNGDQKPSTNSFTYDFKKKELPPGKYEVKCRVKRGDCTKTYSDSVEIVGPVAGIKLFNDKQCLINRKVIFVDRSTYLDSANTLSKWVISDPYGDACTINRSQNLNKFKNCNTTIGWFGKHLFSVASASNSLVYTITDTVTGCWDEVKANINMLACGNCDPRGSYTLCNNQQFLPGNKKDGDPIKFSLDSGRTWLPFPSMLGNKYAGLYDVDLVFETKDDEWAEEIPVDSIRIHSSPITIYDTLHLKNFLNILKAKEDTVSFNLAAQCNPTVGEVHLTNGIFYKGEKIHISWGDGSITSKTFTETTTQKLFLHNFNDAGGEGKVIVTLTSSDNCLSRTEFSYEYGHETQIVTYGTPCLGSNFCLKANITNYKVEEQWDTINKLGKVKWLLNGEFFDSSFRTCLTFDSIGKYTFELLSTTPSGCTDTVTKVVYLHEVIAGITDESKGFYCDGQRQFFDSSYIKGNASIGRYHWDFGTGIYSSAERHPVVAFDGKKKIVRIRHMVVSKDGCRDETEFDMRVLASDPYFEVNDTIGCAPFDAVFENFTTGAKQYIWEFGDTNNLTVETNTLADQHYTYHAPGTYYIRLIGIDSFLNTKTGSIETCHTIYPKLGNKGVKVIVLPSEHLGLSSLDKLCVNQKGFFYSRSYTTFDSEIWNMGDGSENIVTQNGQLTHSYSAPGKYVVSIFPTYLGHSVVPKCISAIRKVVEVVDVEANFSIDPISEPPLYSFINNSDPRDADFSWDFDHPSSGTNNFSNMFEPSHNYGKDTGRYKICLIASLDRCVDTVCKEIFSKAKSSLNLSNVFTPGNGDGLNDVFQVELEGQAFHELTIYNRWGELVFESTKNEQKNDPLIWNGNTQNIGPVCPSGTYFYVLKYAFYDNLDDHQVVHGIVTLIRD